MQEFKNKLQDELNQRFAEAQVTLSMPATTEASTNLHEIGVIRGYMKGLKEAFYACGDIYNELTSSEKKQ